MPQMGVSVAEGTIVEWRVGVGDPIAADQTICDISTDKIDTEVPAPVSGVVTEILVPVEATVPVGEVLARIAAHGEGFTPETTPTPTPTRDAPDSGASPNGGSSNGAGASAGPRSGRSSPSGRRYS